MKEEAKEEFEKMIDKWYNKLKKGDVIYASDILELKQKLKELGNDKHKKRN